jgi:hypothetical protein
MDSDALFWKMMCKELPPPKAAEALGMVFKRVDAKAGTVEADIQGMPDFAPTLNKGIDVCFLAAELLRGGEIVATATATAIIRTLRR